jgi:hypothetical protein
LPLSSKDLKPFTEYNKPGRNGSKAEFYKPIPTWSNKLGSPEKKTNWLFIACMKMLP